MHSQWQQRLQLLFSLLLVAAAATAATAARTTATAATATAATAASALAAKPPVPPAAVDSICSRSKHVVPASFGEPDEYHTVSLYFASKFPNASVHHMWLYFEDKTEEEGDNDASDDDAKETTKKSTSTTSALRWQLLRNRAAELKKKKKSRQHKSPVDWRAFYRPQGIHRSVVDMASLDAYHKLRATYLHSSVDRRAHV